MWRIPKWFSIYFFRNNCYFILLISFLYKLIGWKVKTKQKISFSLIHTYIRFVCSSFSQRIMQSLKTIKRYYKIREEGWLRSLKCNYRIYYLRVHKSVSCVPTPLREQWHLADISEKPRWISSQESRARALFVPLPTVISDVLYFEKRISIILGSMPPLFRPKSQKFFFRARDDGLRR